MNDENNTSDLKPPQIPNKWESNCFGCSKTNNFGLQLRFYYSKKGCFSECTIPEYFCGLDGIVHGGIIATLLDEVAVWTIMSKLFRIGLTLELNIRYLNPVRVNTKLRVEGQILEYDDKTALVRSTVSNLEGKLLAKAKSKWVFPSVPTIAKIAGINEEDIQKMLEGVIQPIKRNQIE